MLIGWNLEVLLGIMIVKYQVVSQAIIYCPRALNWSSLKFIFKLEFTYAPSQVLKWVLERQSVLYQFISPLRLINSQMNLEKMGYICFLIYFYFLYTVGVKLTRFNQHIMEMYWYDGYLSYTNCWVIDILIVFSAKWAEHLCRYRSCI